LGPRDCCACGLEDSKANGLRQTDRLTEWFLVLHFAAKNGYLKDIKYRENIKKIEKIMLFPLSRYLKRITFGLNDCSYARKKIINITNKELL